MDETRQPFDFRLEQSYCSATSNTGCDYLPGPVGPGGALCGAIRQLVRQGLFAHVGLFRRYGPKDEVAIRWALEITNLTGFADRSLRELSGGECQRVWIAAVVAQEAQILLLDEPTSFLDIGYQVELLDIIHRLSRERGITIVMAIHDLNQAMSIADRISLLDGGQLAFDGDPWALAEVGLIEKIFRVRGSFVPIAQGPPSLRGRSGAKAIPAVSMRSDAAMNRGLVAMGADNVKHGCGER